MSTKDKSVELPVEEISTENAPEETVKAELADNHQEFIKIHCEACSRIRTVLASEGYSPCCENPRIHTL